MRWSPGAACLLAVVLLWVAATPLAAQQLAQASTAANSFATKLEQFRVENDLPAVAGSVFTRDQVLRLATTGVRSVGKPEPVTDQDRWHIGSLSKSFTSALAAHFVEQGRLQWDQKLSELLPDLVAADSPYAAVTLRQLLSHRGGLEANPSMQVTGRIRRSTAPIEQQRREAVAAVLDQPPTSQPGSTFLYSNAGFITAGAVLERLTGKAWEESLRETLLEPLGLTSAGFGAPGTQGVNDQPRGHTYGETTGRRFPAEPPLADNPAFFGPAGTIHLSLGDLTRWGQWHLAGQLGTISADSPVTQQATFDVLHTPAQGHDYALGWVQQAAPAGEPRTIWHNGSNTYWYALLMFQPEVDLGVVLITNAGIDAAKKIDEQARLLLESFAAAKDPR